MKAYAGEVRQTDTVAIATTLRCEVKVWADAKFLECWVLKKCCSNLLFSLALVYSLDLTEMQDYFITAHSARDSSSGWVMGQMK